MRGEFLVSPQTQCPWSLGELRLGFPVSVRLGEAGQDKEPGRSESEERFDEPPLGFPCVPANGACVDLLCRAQKALRNS